MEEKGHPYFKVLNDEILYFEKKKVIPNDLELKEKLMREVHCTPYIAHPGSTKIYRDLKEKYWWEDIKKYVAAFVTKYSVCQLVKIVYQKPARELQALLILNRNEKIYL